MKDKMSNNKKTNHRGQKTSQLKVELIGGCLLVYREAPSEKASDGTVRNGKVSDLYSEYLGAFQQNWKKPLPYPLKEGEDNIIYLLQEMTPLQCRGLQLTKEMMELRLQRQEFQNQLEGLNNVLVLEPEIKGQMGSDARRKELERRIRSLEEQENALLDLHNREVTGEKPLEEEVSTLAIGMRSEEPMYAAVFSMDGQLYVAYGAISSVYNNMLKSSIKVKNVGLNNSRLWVDVWVRFENLYQLELGECRLCVGDLFSKAGNPVILDHVIDDDVEKRKYLLRFTLPTRELGDYSQEEYSPVKLESNLIVLTIMVNGVVVPYRLKKKIAAHKRFGTKHSPREMWLPVGAAYVGDYSIQVRRTMAGTFILFKRHKEPVESTAWYRFMESPAVSCLLFNLGRAVSHLPKRKKVALFYEKFSDKAEEGVFELCQKCSERGNTRCYFIISGDSPDYQRIKGDPCVVRKYSLKYYWLIYAVNYYIASEAPMHLTIFNSHNRYMRWSFLRHPFVFLQHGINCIKPQGEHSTFYKGKPGQCSYILVSSPKEKLVVTDTFRISPGRIWVTGQMMFDHCQYKHMNQQSPDKVTVMLTWKPYEKYLDNFESSTYFKYTMQVYELLQKYVPGENISIVAHPHAYESLKKTSLRDRIWEKPISEVLKQSKLLVTDYSSVCWNSFYQGGGVVFYQPDLEEYEAYVGKLLLGKDEYIGHRVFDEEHLEEVLRAGLEDGRVNLDYFRTPEFERRYTFVNAFHDGQNTNRLIKMLAKYHFV